MAAMAQERQQPRRGHLGGIYEDIFKDLYPASPSKDETAEDDADVKVADGEAAAETESGSEIATGRTSTDEAIQARPWDEIDLAAEDAEIDAITAQLQADHDRIHIAATYLQDTHELARQLDKEHRVYNEKQTLGWQIGKGLVVGQDIPVPDSQLRNLLHHPTMNKEALAIPRHMMHHVERNLAIKRGAVAEHGNLLAVSRPDAHNYLKYTGSNMNRITTHNIRPCLTEAQRTQMGAGVQERNRQHPSKF